MIYFFLLICASFQKQARLRQIKLVNQRRVLVYDLLFCGVHDLPLPAILQKQRFSLSMHCMINPTFGGFWFMIYPYV